MNPSLKFQEKKPQNLFISHNQQPEIRPDDDIEDDIQQTKYEIKDFQIITTLGYGGSGGSVEKVKHISTGIIMAKKVKNNTGYSF